MIDPAEAIETYRAASAIAAFDAIQVAFAALVKKGILSKVEAEQILRQAIETIKTGGAGDQAAELLAIALEKISKFEPAPRRLCNDDNSDLPRPPYCRHVRGIAALRLLSVQLLAKPIYRTRTTCCRQLRTRAL